MKFRIKASPLSIGMAIVAFAAMAGAADTFEPWAPGLSDLELYTSHDDREGWTDQLLLGYGAPHHLGLALTWGRELAIPESNHTVGGLIAWTPWERGVDLDLFGQYLHSFLESSDGYLLGAEVSRHGVSEKRMVPYSRLFWELDTGGGEGQKYYALIGLLINFGPRVQLLGEAQETISLLDRPRYNYELGLNLKLTEDLELITEVRNDRAPEEPPCYTFTVGVIATLEELGKKTALHSP